MPDLPRPGPRPLYAVAIHHCIATNDLAQMKELLREAEKFLAEHGDVSAAIELLRAEVAKAEAAGR